MHHSPQYSLTNSVLLYERTSTVLGGEKFRYGFNSMEKDDEVKGNGNSYDFGARMLDPRLGRWLTVDPLAGKYPSLSPYNFVANSPLILIDPDGERIKFAKGLSREEKKEYKSHLKYLRDNSETFAAIYKDVKKSKNIYTLDKTEECNGDMYDPENKTLYVNFDGNDIGIDIPIVIAHEWGHLWRDEMDLDIAKTSSPYPVGSIEEIVFSKKLELGHEFEATHIENVVRSELGYSDSQLRQEYGIKSDFTSKSTIKIRGKEQLDLSKKKPILIGRDSSYDYSDKSKNHYDELLKRKQEPVNVNEYEDENSYK